MTYPRVAPMPRRSHAATIVLTAIAASIALLIANLGFASASHAATFGYLDYSLLPNGNITITGCAGGTSACPASIVIPDTINDGGTVRDVEQISTAAFGLATTITSVTIGNRVTTIGNQAFLGATNLATLDLGTSVQSINQNAFKDTTSLTSLTIPNSVTSIGPSAFYNTTASGLTTVNLGSGLVTIGNSAFENSPSLTSITIPNSVTSIGSSAFKGGTNLATLTLGSELQTIGAYAFYNDNKITSITIPNKVTSIGNYAFQATTSKDLASLTLGSELTTIGQGAFKGADKLTSLTIPNKVTTIGLEAFSGATGLTSLTLGSELTTISGMAFYNDNKITSITIPNKVTTIGSDAFRSTSPNALASLTLGSELTSIGNSAFQNSPSLTSLTIPNKVSSIGSYAFSGSDNLTSLTVGEQVSSIGSYAFSTSPLTTVRFLGASAPTLGDFVFPSGASPWASEVYYRKAGGSWPATIVGHTLTEVAAPSITAQPTSSTVASGSSVTLNVAADAHTGGGTTSYQWFKDGNPVSGATSSSLTLTASGSTRGSYNVEATTWAGTTSSASATVALSATTGGLIYTYDDNAATVVGCDLSTGACPASITIPNSISVGGSDFPVTAIAANAFSSATSITAISIGSNVASIGVDAFSGATGVQTVRFESVNGPTIGTDAFSNTGTPGFYRRTGGTNWPGSIGGYPISVISAPSITSQPTDVTVDIGASATLSVVANADTVFGASYQWFKGSDPVAGATSSSLHFNAVAAADAGAYTVKVTDWAGTVTSAPATLAYTSGSAGGVTYMATTTFDAGTPVRTLTITGCAGTCPPEVVIPGTISVGGTDLPVVAIAAQAFKSSPTLSSVRFLSATPPSFGTDAFTDTGTAAFYRRKGENGWPSSVDGHSIVAVEPPQISVQPKSVSVQRNSGVQLTVAADSNAGGGTLSYQWIHDGSPIAGATNSTLDLGTADESKVGNYSVAVTNWVGTTTSVVASVSLATPTPPSVGTPVKANQAIALKLPTTLKRKQNYPLPTTSSVGVRVTWRVAKNAFCSVKKSTLRCAKSTGRSQVTLTGTAPGTATHNSFTALYKRKVK